MAVDYSSFNCLPEHQGPAFRTWSRILQTATMNSAASPTSPLLSPTSYSNLESSFPKLMPAESFIPFEPSKNGERSSRSHTGTHLADQGGILDDRKNGLTENGKHNDEMVRTYAPWKKRSYPEDARGLHLEVRDFYEYMMPTAEEAFMRKCVVQRMTDLILNIWPAAKVEVFGSYKTKLYLPTSDIDMVVFGQWEKLPLWTLEKALVNEDIADQSTIKVLDKASVPIVKFTDKQSRIKVDISFNMDTAVKGAELIQEFLKEYKVLPQLFLLLKHFLVMRDLNEVFTGGISSYCLMLLTVSFLQMHPRQESKLPDANLGVLLVEFFELYGRNFNYQRTGIKIRNGGCYCSKDEIMREMADGQFPSLLCIEDPVSKVIDIGKSSFGILRVKEAFEYAYSVLESALRNRHYFKINPDSTYLSRIIQVPPEIIHYRRWVKENFKIPSEKSNLVNVMSSSEGGVAEKSSVPQEIDLISTDDFPPLQTVSSSSQKDRAVSKSSSIDNSEIKPLALGGRTGTLYSSVGATNKPKQNPPSRSSTDSTNGSKTESIGSALQDVTVTTPSKVKGNCPQLEVVVTESEVKSKEIEESEDHHTRDLESPSDDFIDEFVLDPYVSWGDICDDSLAGDEDEFSNAVSESCNSTEVPIGNGGLSAWSYDEGPSQSTKQSNRPTYLATGNHDVGHRNGRRYSYNRRNRRTRSPCEGIGEQDLACARHTRQLIISSPEKPIIKPEKWAREEPKNHTKDQKTNDQPRGSGFDEKHRDQKSRPNSKRDFKEQHGDTINHSRHSHEQISHDSHSHNHKYGSGHRRRGKRDSKPF